MQREILLSETENGRRIVVLEDGVPVELLIETEKGPPEAGNLYMGRVENVIKGMQAAFVNIGDEKNAFLPLMDMPSLSGLPEKAAMGQKRSLRPGDEVLVQVAREAAGEKGARLSMHISFPGKYAVLLPTMEGVIGISRHIDDTATREALSSLATEALSRIPGFGVIIRTAARDVKAALILAEIEALAAAYTDIAAKARVRKAPALLHSAGGLAERAMRDLSCEAASRAIPPEIDAALEKALRRRVWLDSGAYIVIDACEAMTVVDVNSGKYVGKSSLNDTARTVNLEAAREIARQIRLRDMGGIIVIDFVDMDTDEDRQAVAEAFTAAMENDRAKRRFHGFSAAGLYELTRRSILKPLLSTLYVECPRCRGAGYVRAHEPIKTQGAPA